MEYDDIIVGAGSSGAVLAARLSEDPDRNVLLLEAGPDYRTIDETPNDLLRTLVSFAEHDWGWIAKATPQREIPFWRGKVTGGCSAINASVAIRGMPADFDQWAALGNDQWSFEKVLPFHRKLEHDVDFGGDVHGKSGPIWIERAKRSNWHPLAGAFHAACRAMGFPDSPDFNDPESTGVGPWPRNLRDGIRVSTAIGYVAPARRRLNLTIRGECLANRVLIEKGHAVGVEVESGGEMQRIYGKRITLSAGALASPAILMRSGVGPRTELDRHGIHTLVDASGVGANLIDHPLFVLLAELTGEAIRGTERTDHSRYSVGLRYTADGSDEFNDMQLYFLPILDWNMVPGFPVEPGIAPMLMVLQALQRPRSRGRLGLRSANPHDQPVIELNLLADPEDMRRMVDGARLTWRIAHQPDVAATWHGPMLTLGAPPPVLDQATIDSDGALAAFIHNGCATICHPVGTVKMGSDNDPTSVVDQYCRVRGVEGLRVVDASVMPNIVRANTNLTCIMIGERVADWMRKEA
ncbi:MAG TPA: GMC oxidoreductase [Candidatus Binataceae bacterium]|nr:GMC oxidoreductase [Candidatus Binataceae bacterium]